MYLLVLFFLVRLSIFYFYLEIFSTFCNIVCKNNTLLSLKHVLLLTDKGYFVNISINTEY